MKKFILAILFGLLGAFSIVFKISFSLFIIFSSISSYFWMTLSLNLLFRKAKDKNKKDEKIDEFGAFYRELFKDFFEPHGLSRNDELIGSIPTRKTKLKNLFISRNYYYYFKYMTPRKLQFMILVVLISGIAKSLFEFSVIQEGDYIYKFKEFFDIIYYYVTLLGLIYTIFSLNVATTSLFKEYLNKNKANDETEIKVKLDRIERQNEEIIKLLKNGSNF